MLRERNNPLHSVGDRVMNVTGILFFIDTIYNNFKDVPNSGFTNGKSNWKLNNQSRFNREDFKHEVWYAIISEDGEPDLMPECNLLPYPEDGFSEYVVGLVSPLDQKTTLIPEWGRIYGRGTFIALHISVPRRLEKSKKIKHEKRFLEHMSVGKFVQDYVRGGLNHGTGAMRLELGPLFHQIGIRVFEATEAVLEMENEGDLKQEVKDSLSELLTALIGRYFMIDGKLFKLEDVYHLSKGILPVVIPKGIS